MWPIPDGDDTVEKSVRDFMCNILDIPRITVARIRIKFARRISTSRRSKVENEVLVRFADVGDRDVVQSFAPNLAKQNGKAGVRLEVPTHLRQAFRVLEGHSSELKKQHQNAKRSIKLDDSTLGLVLDVRISELDTWVRIDPKMVEESRKSRGTGEGNGSIGRATPGGKAGRRALLIPSPGEGRSSFTQSQTGGWGSTGAPSAPPSTTSEGQNSWESGSTSKE